PKKSAIANPECRFPSAEFKSAFGLRQSTSPPREPTMPVEITMPQLSDTMTEGTVVKWYKKEGDKAAGGEKIADVETDKAFMETESFGSGTLAAIVAVDGAKVAVGGLLAVLAKAGENAADIKKKYASGGAATAKAATPSPAQQAVARAEGNAQAGGQGV